MAENRTLPVPTRKSWRSRYVIAFMVAVATALSIVPNAYPASVTLAWGPVKAAELRGYKIYHGTTSRNYSAHVTLGKVTSGTVTGLTEGRTYFFAVTSYAVDEESNYSKEISYTVPISNHTPVARNGSLSTGEDKPVSGTLTATDQDGDPLTFSILAQGALGTAALKDLSSGSFTYTPKPNVHGKDTFTFMVDDGKAGSNVATVSVTITPVNDALVARADTAITDEGTPVRIDVLANDTDPEGSALTLTSTTKPANGTVRISGNFAVYIPKAGFRGSDTFSYTVSDAQGKSTSAQVSVVVRAVNRAPAAANRSLQVLPGNVFKGMLKATDDDGDPLTYSIVTNGNRGRAAITNRITGAFTYTPNTTVASGTDSFTFKANDGGLDSNTATVAVRIRPHAAIYLEAEQGLLHPPMEQDVTSSGIGFIWVPVGQGTVSNPLQEGGWANYTFTVATAGDYMLWGREYGRYVAHNSFFVSVDSGPFVTWNIALVNGWLWDQLRDGYSGSPVKMHLGAGDHTLRIKQREDGTRLDKILITSMPEPFPSTVYSSVSRGLPGGWSITDSDPPGAGVVVVFDSDRRSNVIQLSGTGTANQFHLGTRSFDDWHNSKQFALQWSMKFTKDYVLLVQLKTTAGYRVIRYRPLNENGLGDGQVIDYGLGSNTRNGEWHTFMRNLQTDLANAQPGVRVLEVNGLSIRGSGRIDNVRLKADL
jgi:VCBS repeat-containing protein